jgi:hypothetical protein
VDALADRAVEPADVSHQEQHLIDGRTVGHGAAPSLQGAACLRGYFLKDHLWR